MIGYIYSLFITLGAAAASEDWLGVRGLSAMEVKRRYWPAWEQKWPRDDPPFTWNWPWKQPWVHCCLNNGEILLTACELLELIYGAFPSTFPPSPSPFSFYRGKCMWGVRRVLAFKFLDPAAALLSVCTDLWRGTTRLGSARCKILPFIIID